MCRQGRAGHILARNFQRFPTSDDTAAQDVKGRALIPDADDRRFDPAVVDEHPIVRFQGLQNTRRQWQFQILA